METLGHVCVILVAFLLLVGGIHLACWVREFIVRVDYIESEAKIDGRTLRRHSEDLLKYHFDNLARTSEISEVKSNLEQLETAVGFKRETSFLYPGFHYVEIEHPSPVPTPPRKPKSKTSKLSN